MASYRDCAFSKSNQTAPGFALFFFSRPGEPAEAEVAPMFSFWVSGLYLQQRLVELLVELAVLGF